VSCSLDQSSAPPSVPSTPPPRATPSQNQGTSSPAPASPKSFGSSASGSVLAEVSYHILAYIGSYVDILFTIHRPGRTVLYDRGSEFYDERLARFAERRIIGVRRIVMQMSLYNIFLMHSLLFPCPQEECRVTRGQAAPSSPGPGPSRVTRSRSASSADPVRAL
jgi:hypothetical protein